MRLFIISCCFYILENVALGQNCEVYYPAEKIPLSGKSAETFLSQFFKEKLNTSFLRLTHQSKSLAATHWSFEQILNGYAIANSYAKISIANSGEIVSIYEQLATISKDKTEPYKDVPKSIYTNSFEKIQTEEKVWWNGENGMESAVKIVIENTQHQKSSCVYTQNGKVDESPLSFHFAQDSLVSGKVFYPDPLTSSGNIYGGNYLDFGDADTTYLNNERVSKIFKVEFDSLVFKLQSPHIELQDLDNDGTPIATSTLPVFDFTRGQKGFEDVNAFYHISSLQQRLVDLGFSVSTPKVIIDPHGTTADNSFFSYPNFIYFGTGGVDDAEDADVLVHEYTHFLSRNAAPNTNVGMERQGLDEGLGDYVAASYSQAISSFKKEWLFNWDGHNEFWSGRIINSTRLYPIDKLNNIYKDGEMWSSTLMQIHDELGRGKTDTLLFESLYQYAANMSYPMAARALLKTDTLLFGGANSSVLSKHLGNRCYIQSAQSGCNVGIALLSKGKLNIVNTAEGFILSDKEQVLEFALFDLLGKQVVQTYGAIFSNRKELPSSIYILYANTKEGIKVAKWWSGY